MTPHELKMLKYRLRSESEKQTLEALLVAPGILRLPRDAEKFYAAKALEAAREVDRENYRTERYSFLKLSEELLAPYAWLTREEKADMLRRMYTRYMEGRIRCFEQREREEHAELPPIEPGEDDFHNTTLAAVFAHLPPQPETAAWLKTIDVSWTYDRLHMVSWFSCQLTLGAGDYSRSRPNHSAKVTYERLLNPYSLLWIAAALGEDRGLVLRLGHEIKNYAAYRARCGVIRRAIPWKRIYGLALPLAEAEKENVAC